MFPVYDTQTPKGQAGLNDCLDRLRATTSASGDVAQLVSSIVDDVKERGDAALVRYVQKFSDPSFTADRLRVSQDELNSALDNVDPDLLDAIKTAIKQVREYQQHIMPKQVDPITIGGAELGLRFTPVDSVGLCVPGGTAVLFSTLIMLAVPAIVAGVDPKRISVAHPLPTLREGDDAGSGDISPIVLAAAHQLGIDKVYRVGGAEAVVDLEVDLEDLVDLIGAGGPGHLSGGGVDGEIVAGEAGRNGHLGVELEDQGAVAVRVEGTCP